MKIKMVVPALVVLSVSLASVAFASESDWAMSFRGGSEWRAESVSPSDTGSTAVAITSTRFGIGRVDTAL